jgi:glycerate-2-kinase
MNATKKVLELLKSLSSNDILICLISGGGSALLSLPTNIAGQNNDEENLKLKLETIKSVVNAGCNINKLNAVRSCLSMVKAGKLAELAYPAKIISLIISDVINDELGVISSGPTCLLKDTSNNFLNSLDIIDKHNLKEKIPKQVIQYLEAKCLEAKCTSFSSNDSQVSNYLIGNNKFATTAILNHSALNEYNYKKILMNDLEGEAKYVGAVFACLAFLILRKKPSKHEAFQDLNFYLNKTDFKEALLNSEIFERFDLIEKLFDENVSSLRKSQDIKVCFISGGETTVTLADQIGKGGRNMEMTLGFELAFSGLTLTNCVLENYELLFSSFGTDGIDGPTDSAGAYFETSQDLNKESTMDKMIFNLLSHNSYEYYSRNERLLRTGPTGTNVSDIQVLLINLK